MSLVICAPTTLAIAYELNTNNNFLLVFYLTAPNLVKPLPPYILGRYQKNLVVYPSTTSSTRYFLFSP